MHGMMQDRALSLPLLMDGIENRFALKQVVTEQLGNTITTTFEEVARRIRKLAGALDDLEVPRDARVGSFGWNSQRHLELYMAVPCTNRILHTVNHRLFADDIVYIVNDAEDDILFVDRSIFDIMWPLLDRCPTVRHIVVADDGDATTLPDDPRIHDYETLLATATAVESFTVTDERSAASLCYTSGTTGRPKGVLYDHRSIILHAMSLLMVDSFAISEGDTVMPIVPMFHVNAWGLPYAALMSGADLVMPGPLMTPQNIVVTMATHRVSVAAAVATVWQNAVPFLDDSDLGSLRRIISGGGALPVSLSNIYVDKVGLPLSNSWGMTETSPLVCSARVPSDEHALSGREQVALLATPGPPTALCSLRLVDQDGNTVVRDGKTSGELQVSGPTIAGGYFGESDDGSAFTADGWLRTGDVATIDRRGFVRIVDRTKDLIKSGGEWISSVELENEIVAMEGVAEAAVIAVPDVKWGERPFACIVTYADHEVTARDVRAHLTGKVANWWIPEQVLVVDSLPKTATGKLAKVVLRNSLVYPTS